MPPHDPEEWKWLPGWFQSFWQPMLCEEQEESHSLLSFVLGCLAFFFNLFPPVESLPICIGMVASPAEGRALPHARLSTWADSLCQGRSRGRIGQAGRCGFQVKGIGAPPVWAPGPLVIDKSRVIGVGFATLHRLAQKANTSAVPTIFP